MTGTWRYRAERNETKKLFSFIFSSANCAATQTAEADLKKLADAVAELEPALEVFIAKYGALDKVPVDLAQQFLRGWECCELTRGGGRTR